MNRDDAGGYVLDEIHRFIMAQQLTPENIRRKSASMSFRYSAADLGIRLTKMIVESNES